MCLCRLFHHHDVKSQVRCPACHNACASCAVLFRTNTTTCTQSMMTHLQAFLGTSAKCLEADSWMHVISCRLDSDIVFSYVMPGQAQLFDVTSNNDSAQHPLTTQKLEESLCHGTLPAVHAVAVLQSPTRWLMWPRTTSTSPFLRFSVNE